MAFTQQFQLRSDTMFVGHGPEMGHGGGRIALFPRSQLPDLHKMWSRVFPVFKEDWMIQMLKQELAADKVVTMCPGPGPEQDHIE